MGAVENMFSDYFNIYFNGINVFIFYIFRGYIL